MKKKVNKYKALLVIMILICLVLLPECFEKEEMVFRVAGSDIAGVAPVDYHSPEMVLEPGVYQVRVHDADLPQNGMMSIILTSSSSFHKALRGNLVIVFGGQKEQDFEVYVLDTVQDARLECTITDADYSAISEICIYRTNMGARMLLSLLLFGGGVIFGIMYFRDKILSGEISKSRQIVIWVLLAGIFIAYMPYLSDYFIIKVADRPYHLLRIEGLKETLLHGNQFPVRVQDYWLYDHGYMTSVFYSDFFLYFPAILRIIGFPLGFVSKCTVFIILVIQAVTAFHCFYKCTDNDYAALFGSICILLSPYNFHNIYSRGALGEYTAMAFIPLIIAGMFLLYTKDTGSSEYKSYKWYLIAGLSFILQCHLITCEMSAVMVIVFCLIHLKKTFRRETFIQLAETAVIVLLINCFFWLPMLHMMGSDDFAFHSLTTESIQSKGIALAHLFQLTTNKGAAQTGMYNAEAMQPGAALLFALLLFVIYGLRAQKDVWRKYCVHFFVWVTVLLFMSTKHFPWDLLKASPVLNFLSTAIQFPYRLLSPVIMFGGFFLAFFYLWMRKRFSDWVFKGCVAFLMALCVIPAVYQVNDIAFVSDATRLYSAENMGTISVINGEYLLEGSSVDEYHYHEPAAGEHITYSDYIKKGTSIQMNITNSSSMTEYIEVPLTGYKGYVVTSPLYIAEERGNNNDLRIAVPGGYSGAVTICYKEMPLYLAADLISLISVLLLAGFRLFQVLYRRKCYDER